MVVSCAAMLCTGRATTLQLESLEQRYRSNTCSDGDSRPQWRSGDVQLLSHLCLLFSQLSDATMALPCEKNAGAYLLWPMDSQSLTSFAHRDSPPAPVQGVIVMDEERGRRGPSNTNLNLRFISTNGRRCCALRSSSPRGKWSALLTVSCALELLSLPLRPTQEHAVSSSSSTGKPRPQTHEWRAVRPEGSKKLVYLMSPRSGRHTAENTVDDEWAKRPVSLGGLESTAL